ncbi:Histidine triad (HIT) protein [Penicillium verhagenii]|uniref:Histidine triad (HIT) protein n=1 Tax=Penicillium verhagenii TaxID=1562060 RepID=UPI0025458657|nr:Histidine triad (HIT) protein [Penicillium verhagenii]KAJ5935427.1 Histidine triad (HIT) protein [Penicillium verhagenii]
MPCRCVFCNIAATYPPAPFHEPPSHAADADSNSGAPTQPTAHMILSTKHVMAFLDIMPLTAGHVLVAPRLHYEKLGDMEVKVGKEMGVWLPIISRVVTKTIFGEDPDRHWNVVQNNGARAAQVVPHVHFHIIPRPSTDGVHKPGFAMFGRGQRSELDDDEGEELARAMRAELAREIERIHREEGVDLSTDHIKRGKL